MAKLSSILFGNLQLFLSQFAIALPLSRGYKQLRGVPAGATRKNTMASPTDRQMFDRRRSALDNTAQMIQKFPSYPVDVKQRFPSLNQHEQEIEAWRVKTNAALRGGPGNT